MTWAMQALHVARKDVRYTRAALALYSAIVVVTLVHAISLPGSAAVINGQTPRNPLGASMFILVVLGITLAATAVQTDSPVQSNAFWASRPFEPTAILSAKLLYCAAVLLGIPLAGELIGLMQFDATGPTIVKSLLASIAMYGLMLLAAVVVASLTTDLRGFIVGLLVLLVGCAVATAAMPESVSRVLLNPPLAVSATVAVVVALALLVWLYRRRDVGRVAWIGAVIAVSSALVAFTNTDWSTAREVPPSLRTAKIVLQQDGDSKFMTPSGLNASASRLRVPVRFSVTDAPESARLSLHVDSAQLRFNDGSRLRAAPFYGYMPVRNGGGALPRGVSLYGTDPNAPATVATALMFDVDSAKLSKLGVAGVDVWADVQVAEAVPLTTSRVGAGRRTASAAGTRVRISDTQGMQFPPAVREPGKLVYRPNAVDISVQTATVGGAGQELSARDFGMALINESRREGLVLTSRNYANSNDWLVLPPVPVNSSVIAFNSASPLTDGAEMVVETIPGIGPVSETTAPVRDGAYPGYAWYKDAKIVVVRWITRGSYPVRLTKTLN